jgi:hypothetical protein
MAASGRSSNLPLGLELNPQLVAIRELDAGGFKRVPQKGLLARERA